LFGDESEELQATMVKLQGAMSALAGIQAVANTLNKESALSTNSLSAANIVNSVQTGVSSAATYLYATAVGTATGATKAFRIALLATGIGAVIVLLGAAAYAMSKLGGDTDKANEKLERLKKIREDLNAQSEKEYELRDANRKAASDGTLALKRELDLLVAKGASEKQIYEASKKLKEQERKDINDQIGSLGDSVKRTQELKDNENEMNILDEAYKKSIRDKADADNKKAQEKRNAETLKNQQELAAREKKTQEEIEAEKLKKQQDLIELIKELSTKEALNGLSERDKEIQILNDSYNAKMELAKGNADLEAALLKQKTIEITAISDKYRKDEADKTAANDKKIAEDKKQADAQALADQKTIEAARLSIVNDTYLAINNLGELALGQQFKNTALGKTLALTQIGIDTAMAISSLTKNSQANPTNAVTFGASGIAQFASGIVQITANMLKAKSILSSGGSASAGGGGGSAPSMGGNVSSQPPRLDTFQSNRPAMNPNQRVYVLEKDITDSQGRVARIRHNATLI
jgi:myosin heavy subunit